MMVSPMLAVSFFMSLVAAAFFICAMALILIILIQKGKGGGLSSALGGGLASGILGSKTGDFLTWVTIAMAGVFLALAVAMAKYYKPSISDFGTEQTQQTQQQVPAQQAPVQQELPPPASTDSSQEGETQAPGQPLAPPENADTNAPL